MSAEPIAPPAVDWSSIRPAVLAWFRQHGRSLPWRETRDAYAVLVAEVMLCQTQASRVAGRWERFLARFPSVEALARAPMSHLLDEWSGLGYNRRALQLHATARVVVERHGGVVPDDPGALRALPGVGGYVAAAVAAFAYERPEPVLDVNVTRVLRRLAGVTRPAGLRALASAAVPPAAAWAWSSALMDIGATVCLPRRPRCDVCPLSPWCAARGALRAGVAEAVEAYASPRQAPYRGSRREARGLAVRGLVRAGPGGLSPAELRPLLPDGHDALAVLRALARDGFCRERDGRFVVAEVE